MTVPDWWLYLSGTFFVLFILLLVVMIFLGLSLIGTLKQLNERVAHLGARAEEITQKVDGLVATVHNTTKSLGSSTQGIVGSVETVTSALAGRAEMVGSILMIATLVGKFMAARRNRR